MSGVKRHPQTMLRAAIALAVGTGAAEYANISIGFSVGLAWLALTLTLFWLRLHSRAGLIPILTCLAMLAAVRWSILRSIDDSSALRQLALRGNVTARVRGTIVSVPTESDPPDSRLSGGNPASLWRTRFTIRCQSIEGTNGWTDISGLCRVTVDGRAAARCGRGDQVVILGQLNWPKSPGNPGEFDFAEFLRRRHVNGMLYVVHPQAIDVKQSAGRLSPGYWLTRFRRNAQNVLERSLDPRCRALALALLLGDRSEVPQDTEFAFVSSGTMHLLAISGLHVGILCLLLMRLFHWLVIPSSYSLILVVATCIFYAFITDLQPSVVRATLFVTLFTASQLTMRGVSFSSVIGLSALIMILWQPHVVFDTGAWLSFLSVMALAHAARTTGHEPALQRPVALTTSELVADGIARTRLWLKAHYYPSLWILAATIPLTVCVFHILSPVGLLVNVLLIPATAVVLWLGFATIAFGWLIPAVLNIPAVAFSCALEGLMQSVSLATHLGLGHAYVPDLPRWFLPVGYALLAGAVLLKRMRLKAAAWLGLIIVLSAALFQAGRQSSPNLRCTVLDVGHGSAAVVEIPEGPVMLVDTGAMNRGHQAGEIVSRFLWSRGLRSIDAVLVSHADVDHFNGLDEVFRRFPVGQLLVSQSLIRNDSPAVAELLRLAAGQSIPVRLVTDGESYRHGDVLIDIFQASAESLKRAESDNEKSLVVHLTRGENVVCLPGDLEGVGMTDVLPRLSAANVLVSPHHGSLNANTSGLSGQLRPATVIVSARDAENRSRLQAVYPDSELYFTNDSGAVTIEVPAAGRINIHHFRTKESTSQHLNRPPQA